MLKTKTRKAQLRSARLTLAPHAAKMRAPSSIAAMLLVSSVAGASRLFAWPDPSVYSKNKYEQVNVGHVGVPKHEDLDII